MSDQPENSVDPSLPEDERTRTHNTPTPAKDLFLGGSNPAADEAVTRSGGSPDLAEVLTLSRNPSASGGSSSSQPLVESIGRFRVERVIGEGSFGVVYLGHDDLLKRRVAIKVPQERVIRCPEDTEQYLIEA